MISGNEAAHKVVFVEFNLNVAIKSLAIAHQDVHLQPTCNELESLEHYCALEPRSPCVFLWGRLVYCFVTHANI